MPRGPEGEKRPASMKGYSPAEVSAAGKEIRGRHAHGESRPLPRQTSDHKRNR
jgi:hypothetical protein